MDMALFTKSDGTEWAASFRGDESRVGKGISAQAPHRTVLETLTSHGSSHSIIEKSIILLS